MQCLTELISPLDMRVWDQLLGASARGFVSENYNIDKFIVYLTLFHIGKTSGVS